MKVVILAETFAESMGYSETRVPAAMAKKPGVEVHVVTAGLPAYYRMPGADFQQTYGEFQENPHRGGDTREFEGALVHYLDHQPAHRGTRLRGLGRKLREIGADVVQTFVHCGWIALDAALLQPRLGYRLFTGSHTTASVFPLAQRPASPLNPARALEFVRRGLPGRFISSRAELCYGATEDCSDVARRFFGADPAKVKTLPLGVDLDVFHPPCGPEEDQKALALRRSLGVGDGEILCVYTGRFAEDKNALLLAHAVAALRDRGEPFRALFFGNGVQREAIAATPDAIVHPFVHYTQLGDVFRAADIGVWPTQESMSMMDCAACATPIVVNDTIVAVERVEGNGLTYRLGDFEDLQRALLQLKDARVRGELGAAGARKMRERFSWDAQVQIRLDDYRRALGRDA